MKFDIPAIIRPLDLKEYEPEMDVVLQVWVNPPRGLLQKYWQAAAGVAQAAQDKNTDELDHIVRDVQEWAVEIWSKGPEDTHWTIEEVIQLFDHCQETNPALWSWMIGSTIEMIQEHRSDIKKK